MGPVADWTITFTSTLGLVVSAGFPMAIYWGEEGWLFYNDAWRPILGEKHPWALGRAAREVWPEIWAAIAPEFNAVRQTGEAIRRADSLLPMQRFGYTEECYFDYTLNPIRSLDGKVVGILNVVQETTDRVLNARRTELLRELSMRTTAAKTKAAVCEAAAAAFATDPADFPFSLIYLVDLTARKASLVAADGVASTSNAHSREVYLDTDHLGWPLGEAVRTGRTVTVEDIAVRFGTTFRSPWPEPVTRGLVIPIAGAAQEGFSAVLVVGVNPRRSLDNDYRRLLELAGSHLAIAIAMANSYAAERQRAETARQTKERFDLVKDTTQVGFWFCDLPFDKLEWDNRVKEHFWLSPDAEVTINTFYERIHSEDRDRTRHAIDVSIQTKSHYEIDYRTVSPAGEVKWIRAIGRGFYNNEGQPIRFDGVTMDISERKKAEALLRDSEAQLREGRERLQAALNGSGAGTFRWNIQTNALDWDENLDRLFGLPAGNTIRSLEKFIAVVHPDERRGVIERCERCAREGADFDMEFRIIWPDGSIRWLDDQGATYRDATGRPLYMTGMCIDITERKRAEEALRAAKEQAEAASRLKDDFLAALSHELRTPLTPVLMTAATLKDDPRMADDIREQLAMMERNIALEARLIDDLLDLTAISHGKLKLRLERCDLNAFIERAIEMVAPDAKAKNLAIIRDFSAAQPRFVADLTRLQQVVWNLLRNAVKFTPPGGKISIRTQETRSPEGIPWLTFEVADTGIGIEQAHLARIFEPFDQGAHVHNHRFGGLGLGLAIARAVVTAHGGTIRAQSEGVGQGATFVVTLPHVSAETLGPLSPPLPPVKLRPLRLLLVEDHASTLQTLTTLLKRDGHQVTTASTIASGAHAAAQGTFDLVISDLGLPDGSGIHLMEQLRTLHGLRGIALSGYGMQEDLARSKAAGFVAHLVKPVAIADLRRALEDAVRP